MSQCLMGALDMVPNVPEKEHGHGVDIWRSIQTLVLLMHEVFLVIDSIAIQGLVTKLIWNADMHIVLEF